MPGFPSTPPRGSLCLRATKPRERRGGDHSCPTVGFPGCPCDAAPPPPRRALRTGGRLRPGRLTPTLPPSPRVRPAPSSASAHLPPSSPPRFPSSSRPLVSRRPHAQPSGVTGVSIPAGAEPEAPTSRTSSTPGPLR